MRLADPFDQASGLRRLFASEPAFQALGVLGPDVRCTARACAALALGFRRKGYRVMVMDETPVPHNVASLLGILPRYGLVDAPRHGLVAVVRTALEGLLLLAAQNGLNTLAGLSENALLDMAEDWRVRADAPEWLLHNGGNGPIQSNGLAATANLRVLVLSAKRSGLAEAYAVMKSAHSAWSGNNWFVLVEGVDKETALNVFASLNETAQRFLDVRPAFLGCIAQEKPGVAPDAVHTNLVDKLSKAAGREAKFEHIDFEQYWQRMWLYSRMSSDSAIKKAQEGWQRAG